MSEVERPQPVSTRSLRSVYDRRRLFEPDPEPPVIDSLRDSTWEHQAEALKQGYQSMLHYVVDLLVQKTRDLEARVKDLEDGDLEARVKELEDAGS